jgi:hypothetical protein
METHAPMFRLQELFVPAAEVKLPPEPHVSWNKYGVMTYFWPSPSDLIKGLWVNVNEHEIMLSTGAWHTHIDQNDWDVGQEDSADVFERIVNQGIAQALIILNDATLFAKA